MDKLSNINIPRNCVHLEDTTESCSDSEELYSSSNTSNALSSQISGVSFPESQTHKEDTKRESPSLINRFLSFGSASDLFSCVSID